MLCIFITINKEEGKNLSMIMKIVCRGMLVSWVTARAKKQQQNKNQSKQTDKNLTKAIGGKVYL